MVLPNLAPSGLCSLQPSSQAVGSEATSMKVSAGRGFLPRIETSYHIVA